jgi:hypothetical protein
MTSAASLSLSLFYLLSMSISILAPGKRDVESDQHWMALNEIFAKNR